MVISLSSCTDDEFLNKWGGIGWAFPLKSGENKFYPLNAFIEVFLVHGCHDLSYFIHDFGSFICNQIFHFYFSLLLL